jgi:hypothetical protein
VAITVSLAFGPVWVLLFFFALWLAGFTFLGIAGGSYAAITQSAMGLVPAASWFSTIQGIAMLGPLAVNPLVYLAFSLVSMVATILLFYYKGCALSSCPCHSS